MSPRSEAPGEGQQTEAGAIKNSQRLAKAIAAAGVCSRRDAEKLITAGKVIVDGALITTPAFNVTPDQVIIVDRKKLTAPETARLFLYHKPRGLLTTHRDPEGRPTVWDKLPKDLPRVVSVGRLDLNSEGLLLLTTSGELARQMELPANALVRRYRVRAFGVITQVMLKEMAQGVTVEGVHYGPMAVAMGENYSMGEKPDNYWLTVSDKRGQEPRNPARFSNISAARSGFSPDPHRIRNPYRLDDLPRGEIKEVQVSGDR